MSDREARRRELSKKYQPGMQSEADQQFAYVRALLTEARSCPRHGPLVVRVIDAICNRDREAVLGMDDEELELVIEFAAAGVSEALQRLAADDLEAME